MRLPLLDRSIDWAAGGRFSVGVWAGAGLWTVDTVWAKVGAGVGLGILSVVQKEGGIGMGKLMGVTWSVCFHFFVVTILV